MGFSMAFRDPKTTLQRGARGILARRHVQHLHQTGARALTQSAVRDLRILSPCDL